MSTFKSGNTRGAASPLGFGALVLACACFAFSGCPVDDRSLDVTAGGSGVTAGSVGSAGTTRGGSQGTAGGAGGGGETPESGEGGAPSGQGGSSGAGGSSSTTAGSPAGGNSSQAGSPEPGGDGCADLDGDGVRDCEQTVATNSRFMTDAAGWEPEPTLQQTWVERDASDLRASGALRVRNGNTAVGPGTMLSGSRQCMPAVGGTGYSVAVNTLIPSGQGEGSAGVAVWFFGSDGCLANSIGNITLQLVSATDVWSVAQGAFQAPGGTRSMHVRLVTAKPFEQASLEALFDDVLVRQE